MEAELLKLLNTLISMSPYAASVIIGFALSSYSYNRSLSEIRKYSEKTTEEIRIAYNDSSKRLSEFLSLYSQKRKGGKS